VAIVVRKNTFKSFEFSSQDANAAELSREDAIRHIVEHLPPDACVISTTGMASRELFEIRKNAGSGHQRDFLTVGGMGHASQIAAGIALSQAQRTVVCIDGDGAILMHTGSLSTSADCPNMIHFVLNNGAHDSVGGQPTKGISLRFHKIAASLGYKRTAYAADATELRALLVNLKPHQGSCFIEVRCKRGSRSNLGRPDRSPPENKADFMDFLRGINAPSH
jgi:phosphonopyruvate decarboxylase